MAEMICPDCKNYISSYAEACPTCGFPMAKFLKEHNLTDNYDLVWCCPKCGKIYEDDIGLEARSPMCPECGHIVVVTDIPVNKYREHIRYRNTKQRFEQYGNRTYKELNAKEVSELQYDEEKQMALKYGNCFDQEEYEERLIRREMRVQKYINEPLPYSTASSSNTNTIKCPTCGSTRVNKISLSKKVAGAGLFGLFSKTAKSQFECKDCGYKW